MAPRIGFEVIQLPLLLVFSFTLMIASDEMIMMMVKMMMTTAKCLLLLASFRSEDTKTQTGYKTRSRLYRSETQVYEIPKFMLLTTVQYHCPQNTVTVS